MPNIPNTPVHLFDMQYDLQALDNGTPELRLIHNHAWVETSILSPVPW